MEEIKATISVDERGHATVLETLSLGAGSHQVVISVIEGEPTKKERKPLVLPKIRGELRDPNDSFRREDMYDDDGR